MRGSPYVRAMTWTDVTAPPILSLPSRPLENAAHALDHARVTLRRAQHAEWSSVLADSYQAELADLDAKLVWLAGLVGDCQHEWARARIAAWGAGQL